MSTEIALADKYEQMNKVVDLKMEGYTPMQIAKTLGIRRIDVNEHLEEYKRIISHDHTVIARARESVVTMDAHTDKIIRKAYEVVESADNEMEMSGTDSRLLSQKLGALKAIAEFEAKRFGMLKEFGLLDDMEVANQVVEMERKQDILVGILREVTNDCPKCRVEVIDRLSQVTGQVEGIIITPDE